ncbi:MAG: GNAT family N-acetyltransferase [Chloroflexi bacterium]|nr:GNAT family N-acetyltransferase [Chloroflexota bacterium]
MLKTSFSLSSIEEKRFGFRTARAFAEKRADLSLINDFCAREKVNLLILRCETIQIDLVHALEKENFSLMDTLLYFRYTVSDEDTLPKKTNISPARQEDESSLLEITKTAFSGYSSHYHADPRLGREKSHEAYLDWASRSCRKEIADEVLIAKSEGKAIGFLSLRKNDRDQVEGPLLAVSPEAQGQGIGKDLMRAAFHWSQEEGAKDFIISTQITNLASQNLWTSLGMKLYHSLYTFHKWFNEE